MSGFDQHPSPDRGLGRLAGLPPGQLAKLARRDPSLYAQVHQFLGYQAEEKERTKYEDSLIEFMKRAWREVESKPLSLNWHHIEIAEHLEKITYGSIRNLIINIPPRHTKTLLANVFWPAWIWCRAEILPLSGPQVKFLCVSYGAILSEEIALKMRRLVMGDWYQRMWGDRVHILEDQKSRANFGNTAGGERMSTSIEGGVLGRGGDITVYDDPQTRKGADSEAERAASIQGMSDLTTRVTDPRISAKVLVQQRLHQNDATDWAVKNWPADKVWLMFPARYEPDRACFADHRSNVGELLWPEVWSNEELTKIEAGLAALDGDVLSDYAISGQLQQNPIPRGNSIIGKDDWRVWPEEPPEIKDLKVSAAGHQYIPLPPVSHVIVSVDTAMSERETADWTACVVLGVWHQMKHLVHVHVGGDRETEIDDGEQPRVILMGGWRMRGKLNDEAINPRTRKPGGLVQNIVATARQFNADRILIENKTRGLDVKNEIERQMAEMPFQVELFEPGRHGDKVARLHSVQPLFSQGLIYAPGRYTLKEDRAGNQYLEVDDFEWVEDIIKEVEAVPRGTHDDYADALSQGILTLRIDGYLALTKEYIAQQMALRTFRSRKSTIRSSYGV